MKKILFATEFSEHAPEVFKYAAEIAYFFKAELLVMHAFGKPDPMPISKENLQQKEERVTGKLADFVQECLPALYRDKLQLSYFAVHAYPMDGILDLALEQDIDLIVLGMTGKTNALGSTLGNTTLNVLAKADCQVLMIPEQATFSGIDHLIFTTDFEFRDLEAIQYLKKWSTVFDAPVHVLHAYEGDENEFGVLKNMVVLKETFKHHKRMTFDLRYGQLEESIEKFAKAQKADLVAMISHKRNLIGRILDTSPVEGIAKRIHIPLLIIKDDAYQFNSKAWEWVELAKSIG